MFYLKPGNWPKKYGLRKYAIHNLHANNKITALALKILFSKICDG